MDEIVRQAMSKWPNVPHCFGWLRLDARGVWRMRDERAQALDLAGEPIRHPALLEFINRNYSADEQGRWHFQNGPQRVFVDLELAPYVAHVHPGPSAGELLLRLHTGDALHALEGAWMDAGGRLYVRSQGRFAAVDDRDLASLLPLLKTDASADTFSEENLLRWIEGDCTLAAPRLAYGEMLITVERISQEKLEQVFGFRSAPRE